METMSVRRPTAQPNEDDEQQQKNIGIEKKYDAVLSD